MNRRIPTLRALAKARIAALEMQPYEILMNNNGRLRRQIQACG